MDLDRFKEVNDTFGHHWGDAILQQVGPRLRSVLDDSDTVARLGGDEFAVILSRAGRQRAARVARRLLQSLERPFVVYGQSLEVGASIGIAVYPEHGRDVETLLRRADVAMYVAKRSGDGYAIYAPELDQYSRQRLALIGDLRQAIERRQVEGR